MADTNGWLHWALFFQTNQQYYLCSRSLGCLAQTSWEEKTRLEEGEGDEKRIRVHLDPLASQCIFYAIEQNLSSLRNMRGFQEPPKSLPTLRHQWTWSAYVTSIKLVIWLVFFTKLPNVRENGRGHELRRRAAWGQTWVANFENTKEADIIQCQMGYVTFAFPILRNIFGQNLLLFTPINMNRDCNG